MTLSDIFYLTSVNITSIPAYVPRKEKMDEGTNQNISEVLEQNAQKALHLFIR
jgi:hypothetical protein